MKIFLNAFLLAICADLGVTSVQGSGSYRHSTPPTRLSSKPSARPVASQRFELGRRLYNGMLPLGEANPGAASEQSKRLKSLTQPLPASQTESINRVLSYAGRLSSEQIAALDYYINERFASGNKYRTSNP